jgi:predicted anti-sigma-YlaC factor YlaD
MGAVNAACMETYLRNTLPRAWRRPVTDSEIVGLMGIFSMASGETRQTQLTMEAALIHPAFLFRTEIGNDAATATGKVQLTPYELASAVSFAVLNSVPDAGLWAKAQDGSLTQSAVLAPR